MEALPYPEAKKLWQCNDKIAELNFQRFSRMELTRNLTPALLSYEASSTSTWRPQCLPSRNGLCPGASSDPFRFFTGYCAPPGRGCALPAGMQPKQAGSKFPAVLCPECLLPACMIFWDRKLFDAVLDESRIILNLASREYSRVPGTLAHPLRYLHHLCIRRMEGWKSYPEGHPGQDGPGRNGPLSGRNPGVLPEEARQFNRLGYRFREELSDASTYVFVKE